MAQESLGLRCAGFSPAFARTHSGILTSRRSRPNVSTGPSPLRERSPTPDANASRPSFGGPLNPDHSRRSHAGRVSYYALFKGMAASKPTSSLSAHDHILRYTQRPLRGLSCGSGFFPSRRWTLSLSDCLLGFAVQWYSEFGWGWYRLRQPAPIQSLYPHEPYRRLYLNRFRREPAISRLD